MGGAQSLKSKASRILRMALAAASKMMGEG